MDAAMTIHQFKQRTPPVRIDHFHVTQQLGFKPILHCWCGATLDMGLNHKGAQRKFAQAHEECKPPEEVRRV